MATRILINALLPKRQSLPQWTHFSSLLGIARHTCNRGLWRFFHSHTTEQIKGRIFLCAHFIPQFFCFFFSSIFIRQDTNWGWVVFLKQPTWLFFSFFHSRDFKVMIWRFVTATGGEWVWDLTIMQVTEALWSWGSSQAEGLKETALFVL